MNPIDRMLNWNLHPSQRGVFALELYKAMATDDRVWLVTADLGYGMFDHHRDDFPDRFLNTGASEQAATGICVGLALQGKIPFLYSITPFLLYRPFEWHRNYLNHEGIPVRLVGSGLNDDYKHDGITHDATDAKQVLDCLPNIIRHFPRTKEEIPQCVADMLSTDSPSFIALRR